MWPSKIRRRLSWGLAGRVAGRKISRSHLIVVLSLVHLFLVSLKAQPLNGVKSYGYYCYWRLPPLKITRGFKNRPSAETHSKIVVQIRSPDFFFYKSFLDLELITRPLSLMPLAIPVSSILYLFIGRMALTPRTSR